MSLHNIVDAHEHGFDENMYLDPATRTKVEETGGANFLFVTKDGTVVTPKSDSILPWFTILPTGEITAAVPQRPHSAKSLTSSK